MSRVLRGLVPWYADAGIYGKDCKVQLVGASSLNVAGLLKLVENTLAMVGIFF